jgi:glycosyltransferase involved in cell wall biosynthesis
VTDEPTLSVVIPVYNDPDGIRLTLESVTGQTYPTDEYEILAVDNGSGDNTRHVIETYCERYPDLVTLLVEDEIQGSYAARNEGIRHARGSLIAFIDADMTVRADWLESLVASHRKHGWDYAGCEMAMYTERETWTARYDTLLRGFPVERYLRERNFVQTGCLTTTQEVFESVGLFDERISSQADGEFGKRVHKAGFDQHFEPEITMYHPARESLRPWLKKQFRIGRGAVELRRYHPEHAESAHPLHPRQFLPLRPRGFYSRLTDATDPTPRETAVFYGLDYASKLARAAGGLYERYCITPEESTD